MTLRDEFEKLCPVPGGVEYSESRDAYFGLYDALAAGLYDAKYQGFLLGRQNTVSVEKYREDAEWISRWRVTESGENGILIQSPAGKAATIQPHSSSDDSKHRILRDLLWLMACDVMEFNSQAKRRTEEV